MLNISSLTKRFSRLQAPLFTPLSFCVNSGESIALSGRNGAGKSTVMKMIAGVLTPSTGSITYNNTDIHHADLNYRNTIGFCAPYLAIYEEFTPLEHIALDASLRNITTSPDYNDMLLQTFGLYERRNDYIKTFSSGMKQRMKLILALHHQPQILLLDEPTTNIDENGIERLYALLSTEKQRGCGIIIATNEQRDIHQCQNVVALHPVAFPTNS